MITEDQILEIERYCTEHQVTQKERLATLGINRNVFYRSKKKLLEQHGNVEDGHFLQVNSNGVFMAPPQPNKSKSKKATKESASSSYLTIELRSERGTALRVQGEMTPDQLREIMAIL